jgi:hypothetical protein
MNNKVLYISDFFYEEVNGGGEANDFELLKLLAPNYNIVKRKSAEVTAEQINTYKNGLIISNFIYLKPEVKEYITKNCKYVIYEHDHKYLRSRNPGLYKDYKAPKEEIVNYEFYKNSSAVLCQSKLHKDIVDSNVEGINSVSLSGNLWSEETLDLLVQLSKVVKSNSYAIMNSNVDHKNTLQAIQYCNHLNYEYELIPNMPHKSFLQKLSNYKGLVFLPKTPETLSRIAVEARMMNMSVITNKNLGASYEDWFKLKGIELINVMKIKRNEIPLIVGTYL